jgi:VIT1/CCC1 family predicted Fe2+/Mn2+ transporter
MFALLTLIVLFVGVARSLGTNPGVARQLLERAEASAGSSPHHARELRQNAFAYLRVIR